MKLRKRASSPNMRGKSRRLNARSASSRWSWTYIKNATPADRRRQRELLHHHRPPACSVRRGCKVIDLPKSTSYYRSTARALNLGDAELVAIIEDIQDELPCYGYRRVTDELHRGGTSSITSAWLVSCGPLIWASSFASAMFERRTVTTIHRSTRTSTATGFQRGRTWSGSPTFVHPDCRWLLLSGCHS